MLYDEQQDAMDKVVSFVLRGGQEFFVFKAAGGTGKTTVIREAVKQLAMRGVSGLVCAFTGRAAAQLRKGGLDASTFHSVLYRPIVDKEGFVVGWETRSLEEMRETVGGYIMCDEASMVDYKTIQSMKTIGVPLIMIGDDEQLPPVELDEKYKDFNPMSSFPHAETATLTVNRRVIDGREGLLKINEHFRNPNNAMYPRKGLIKNGVEYVDKKDLTTEYFKTNEFDVIICGMNKTRKILNEKIRRAHNRENDIPEKGENVICLKNGIIGDTKISNGDIFRVEGTIPSGPETIFFLENIDTGEKINVKVWNETWLSETYPKGRFPKAGSPQTHQLFTYGYALSCHKAQGSTFPRVLLYDEDVSFFVDQRAWRYTAVSRAADRLVVAR